MNVLKVALGGYHLSDVTRLRQPVSDSPGTIGCLVKDMELTQGLRASWQSPMASLPKPATGACLSRKGNEKRMTPRC